MGEELARLYREAREMPYGSARVIALEMVAERADPEDPDNVAFGARQALIYSYIRVGERVKSFVPFAWCLNAYDLDPARYAKFTRDLLWAFKWQPTGFRKFPEISLERLEALQTDMERRYRAYGQGMHGVIGSQLEVALALGRMDDADRLYRQWEATPRDGLSDCVACVPTTKVAYLVGSGQYADALRLAEPVLQGRSTCPEQPHQLLTLLLPAYVAMGRIEEAADAHRRAYRAHRTQRDDLTFIGHNIEFLARTGNQQRALELVEAHLPWLESPESPWGDLELSAAAALALQSLPSQTVVQRGRELTSAGQLAAELRHRAIALADRFDQRNGNGYVGEKVAALINAEPWMDSLPLTAEARRSAEIRKQLTRRTQPADGAVESAALEAMSSGELLDHAERLWGERHVPGVESALQRYAGLVPVDRRTAFEEAHYQELRGLVLMQTDPDAAAVAWGQALGAFRALADEIRTHRVQARMGRLPIASQATEEARATSLSSLRWLADHDDEHMRPGWVIELAQRLTAVDPVEAEARLAGLRANGSPRDADVAAALHAETLLRIDQVEQALTALDAAVALAEEPEVRLQVRMRRGQVRLGTNDPRGAVEDFTEAVALASVLGHPSYQHRLELAGALMEAGDANGAAEAGERVLRELQLAGERQYELYPRRLLTDAYLMLADWEAALVNAQALARLEAESEQARLLEQLGSILLELKRPDEAVEKYVAAVDAAAAGSDHEREVGALRRLANVVDEAQPDLAERYRRRGDALVDLAEEGSLVFHRAGLALDRAASCARRGQRPEAIALLSTAQEDYLRLGLQEYADDCVLRRVRVGDDVDAFTLGEIFERAQEHTDHWYDAGYAYADRLSDAGRESEATAVLVRLGDDQD